MYEHDSLARSESIEEIKMEENQDEEYCDFLLTRLDERLYDYSMKISKILVKIDQLDRDNEKLNEALDFNCMELVKIRRKYGKLHK